MTKKNKVNLWKDELVFEANSNNKIQVGALQLFVTHLSQEWQFRHGFITSDESKNDQKITLSQVKEINKNAVDLKRFIQSTESNVLHIRPKLADRSIVAKPHEPIFLPSQQSITVYISTPVWLSIYVNGSETPLVEMATFPLPDTWFGPKPHIGELCYSSRFSGRINLESLPRRAGRVITPVTVINNGLDNLKLEKLAIPTAYLSVYLNDKGELWTPTLVVTRETESSKTQVKIAPTLHPSLEGAEMIGKPRVTDHNGLVLKTINMLFS